MKSNLTLTQKMELVTILITLFLLFFLFKLQIYDGKEYSNYALNNYVKKRTIYAQRGEIFDRNGLPIVQNYPAIHLGVIPSFIKDKEALKSFLKSKLSLSDSTFNKVLDDARFRRYKTALLSDNLSPAEIAIIAENMNFFPSLKFDIGTTRKYQIPNHFTGYLGRINRKEYLKNKSKGYSYNSYIGKTGIEKEYEHLLTGVDGIELKLVDAKGRDLKLFTDISKQKQEIYKPAIPGMNLTLSIDRRLQDYVETLFPEHSEGSAIVMDYTSGEILAYVSKPTVDQNMFMRRISTSTWEAIKSDTTKPMLDRVSRAVYPTGSVFKIVTSAYGLENNLISRWTKLKACTGGMEVGNHYFKCWNRYGHGSLDVVDALKVSCDVFFYDLSTRMKLDDFHFYVKDSMLSEKSGIDLPNESSGFFPTVDWYKRFYGPYASIKGQMINLSIGQGEAYMTPLQVCALYSGVANQGIWKKPHLLVNATRGDSVIYYSDIEQNRSVELPLKPSTLAIIQEGLRKVVSEKGGTARSLLKPGRKIYGKTGSAEHKKGRLTHAWFAGYEKETNIALCVFREEAGHGGSIAVPIANKIFDYYYDLKVGSNE